MKIFQVTVMLHGAKALEKEVLIDTTVQQKNITFPTDSKLPTKLYEIKWRRQSRNCKWSGRSKNFSAYYSGN